MFYQNNTPFPGTEPIETDTCAPREMHKKAHNHITYNRPTLETEFPTTSRVIILWDISKIEFT